MLQQNQALTVVHDASGRNFGSTFMTKTGGGKGSDAVMVRPGNMADARAFVASPEFGPVTVTRLVELTTDSGLVQDLQALHGERFTLSAQPTDARGRVGFHRPVGYSGPLVRIQEPDYDSSSTDVQQIELEFAIDRMT